MTGVFMVCALIGGTILFFQVVLTLIGLGSEALDIDVPDDINVDGGADFAGDAGGDFDADAGGDFDADAGGDFDADAGGDVHGQPVAHHGSSWVFGVLSFRTIVAALTFFGLAGLAADSAGAGPPVVLGVAVAAGAGAMYGVFWLMQILYRLKAEGTAKIQRALGKHATVYLKIPGHESGTGKIQVNLQNRTMEYLAMTSGDELPTGAKVVVVDVITPTTVEVQPVLEPERIEDV